MSLLNLLLLLFLVSSVQPLCHPDKRSALLQFKESFTGHVIGLDLRSSYLYGSIDSRSSLFHLVHLQWLNLTDNVFKNSKIPSEIRNLSILTSLDLSYSNFSGQIPSEILELSQLELLDLSGNSMKLRKPGLRSLLEKLTNLQGLYLTDVRISSS
ncbi:hypothetical protein POUND7_019981, partial [Theobroma cacao]